MNVSVEPQLEERQVEGEPKLPRMRPKIIDFQRNYDPSLMSTNDGNTVSNIRSAVKFSPSIESDSKTNELDFKAENKDDDVEAVDLGEDPTLIMRSRETSERCESIS